MPSDNEKQNVERMIKHCEKINVRYNEQQDEIKVLRAEITNLHNRITQLMLQMQKAMLIGRGSGPTA